MAMRSPNRKLILELAVVTASLVVLISGMQAFIPASSFLGRYFQLIFAVLFLYVPAFVIKKRGREIDFLDRGVKEYVGSFFAFVVASFAVFPIFLFGAHIWETAIYSASFKGYIAFPDFGKTLAFQLVMVALPEEFFFRGYLQSGLSRIFPTKWKILGARLGWGWILTAVIFAVAHSCVMLQWWHFAIFFPALLFGYLRERTGTITAPILFHAASNIVMAWIGMLYG